MEVPQQLRNTTALCWAAGTGNEELIKNLIENGIDVNLADYDKRTALHIAASDGRVEIVESLLNAGANVYCKDRWGVTPLDCAKDTTIFSIMSKHIRCNLLSDGNPQVLRRSGSMDDSLDPEQRKCLEELQAVYCAIATGDTETLKRAWIDGLKLDVIDSRGRTALHVAVENEQLNVIELLLAAGAAVDIADHHGRTPISIAVEQNSTNILSLLRRHIYLSQNIRSPLASDVPIAFECVKQGDVPRLQQLVPRLVHPDVQDYDSRTLLHVAASEGSLPVVQYLVECGSNVNALDRWGNSPLSEAVYFAHNAVARYLRSHAASEHGHDVDDSESSSQLDMALLNIAFEHVLRSVCRGKWDFGEVFVPIKDDDGLAIALHHVWYRSNLSSEKYPSLRHPSVSDQQLGTRTWSQIYSSSNAQATSISPLTIYRKARSLMLLDPGQDHVGRVFSTQQPEWIPSLHTTSQAKFFFVPHARKAGIKSVISVPMMYKMSVVAILSWYSLEVQPEDSPELHRIQRLVKSVTLLTSLRQESTQTISRFQYCQALENACSGHGELVSSSSLPLDDVATHDVLSLAISWNMFELVTQLATSMSSEDHLAVINLVETLVELMKCGLFAEVLDSSIMNITFEQIAAPINSKIQLIRHIIYYMEYFSSVSPTEGQMFSKSNAIQSQLVGYVRKLGQDDAAANSDNTISDRQPSPPPTPATPECVLCKYNVPGHLHAGVKPVIVQPMKRLSDVRLSIFKHIPSPVYRELRELPQRFADEFDRFAHKGKLINRAQDSFRLTRWSTSDLYDSMGTRHDKKSSFSSKQTSVDRDDVLTITNSILDGTNEIVTLEQVKALHQAIFEYSNGGGTTREDTAVGYASERVYRVFLPAVEIERALQEYVETLNMDSAFPHPLIRAYYAYAAFVFYIHPFYDGNGRCARLLGNIIARKCGYPNVIRHLDKTIQFASFLEATINMLDLQEEAQRNRRGRLSAKTTSTWF